MSPEETLELMRRNPKNIRFADAVRCAEWYFGPPRVHGSHHVFKTPWPGDPRVNLQNRHGVVARYQIDQLIRAIERLGNDNA